MIGARSKSSLHVREMRKKARLANIRSLSHAAGYLRKVARGSIRKSKKASSPGAPPHTRMGRLKKAIVYSVDKPNSVAYIGPAYSMIREIGHAHEFGGNYRRRMRKPNWKLQIGGHGPVRRGKTGYVYAKLRTQELVNKARQVAPEAMAFYRSQSKKTAHYEKRPFMGPALMKSAPALSRFWANSVRG